MFTTVFCVFIMVLQSNMCVQVPENTCKHFSYMSSSSSNVFGILALPNDGSGYFDLYISASFRGVFQPVPELTVEAITSDDELSTGADIKYLVRFPFSDVIPKITTVLLNGVSYCSGRSYSERGTGTTTTWSHLIYDIGTRFNPVKIPEIPPKPYYSQEDINDKMNEVLLSVRKKTENICGVSSEETLFSFRMVGARPSTEGQYPWLAALFLKDGTENGGSYKCVANLISTKHLLTAAHCVKKFSKESLFVEFATLLEDKPSDSRVLHNITEIITSPLYIMDPFGDVAIITVDEKVTFSSNLKPICLWGDSNMVNDDSYLGSSSTIAGWGIDENGEYGSGAVKSIDVVIVPQIKCIKTYHLQYEHKLFVDHCICAAHGVGSPCRGDSGTGLMVKRNGKYFLRGVLSVGYRSCNESSYSVFADISPHLRWLKKFLEQ